MKYKHIGFIAESFGSLSKSIDFNSTELMKASGFNIGNWAFWNATKKIIKGKITLISGHPKAKDFINKIDILIIPAANWLQPRYDFSWLADFIERINKPCIMIGLGAQSHDEKIIPTLTDGTLRMLRAVSSRTPYIGVRGKYTDKVCRHHGIQNVRMMGCPSLFTNNSSFLGQDIAKKWQHHIDGKTIIHASMFPPNVKQVEQWLFAYLTQHHSTSYIVQAPQALIKAHFREPLHEKEEVFLDTYRHTFKEGISIESLQKVLYLKGYSPYSVDAWLNYISFFSRAIGTRIHGSILSISATIPTICITHDVRTKELCDIMLIPSIPCDSIDKKNTVDEIFNQFHFDAIAFNENRKQLAQSYNKLFLEAGISPSQHLLTLLQ